MYNLVQPNRKLEDVIDERFEIKKKVKLFISSTFIESIFSEVISEIITYIDATFKETDNISIVVVVGGFAECPLLKEELKKRYSKFVKIPNEADLAVGSVEQYNLTGIFAISALRG
jgi:6,7-dimethyl-8-ribityllumazine synthase